MQYKKILVTGSSAVLGSGMRAITSQYPEAEFTFFTSADCDLRDLASTREAFAKVNPDAVLHLAAVSGGIGLSIKHPATLLRDNTLMTFAVMEAVRELRIKKLVMTLTAGMYPPDAPLPLNEDSIHAGYPHGSNYGSSFAKRLIDPAIRSYREEYGMNVIGLIPGGIFGEHDNFNEEDANMVPALIRRFYEHKDNSDPIVLWGDGTPLREYSYSQDLARVFLWALENYDDEQVLNIGAIEENSVKDIAYMIADATGVDRSRIEFDTTKPAGVFRKNTDNSRFIDLSGFSYTTMQEGIERTVKWFGETMESNPDVLRLHPKSQTKTGSTS